MADVGQHLVVADVGTVAEIGFEQRFDDAVLHALLAGETDQAMSLHGIGRARELLEMELDTDTRGRLGDALVHLARTLGAAEFGGAVFGAIDTFGRHLGIELEGTPGDGEALLVLLFQDIEGAFKLTLADITPGTNNIRDNVDASGGCNPVHGKSPFRRQGLAYTCLTTQATRHHRWTSRNTALR
jgi:hypothetical protein